MNSFTQDSFFSDEPLDESSTDATGADQEEVDSGSIDVGDTSDDSVDADKDETQGEHSDGETVETDQSDVPAQPEPKDEGSQNEEPSRNAGEGADEEPTAVASPQPRHGLVDPGQEAVDAFFGPVRLERQRLERPPLVPRWIWIALGSVVGVALIVLGAWFLSTRSASIAVPQLTGIDVGVARTRLAEQGLKLAVSEEQFSAQPAQTVLSQTPAPQTKLKQGDTVSVIVSAGSEQFALPDVVGNGLLLARGKLETKGLEVQVETQPSQMPSDTVIASNPPAGHAVHTGDIVRLTVASPGPATALLLPYDMRGVTVVLDPAPVNDALGDVPLDVARRIRSLIEASHGVVRTTRALADTSTLEAAPARARRAGNGPSTVAVGLSASTIGSGGVVVFSPSPVLPHASDSAKLASRIASDIATESGSVSSSTSTTDSVLGAANSSWTRVQLGSYASRDDTAKFADPNWEDKIARAVYRALGSLYGRKPAGS